MLYNELRPHNFDQMVGQKHIVENIRNQSKEDKWFQVYILAGQFGGGKTTMARIIALSSNCKSKDENGNPCLICDICKCILNGSTTDIMEIDAASNRGIDSIRDLKEGTEYKPYNLSKKIYIIDEVHMLSKEAFNALLKLLEEPPSHTMFIMCTTDLKAIPATVRSRSAIYIFEQISFTDIYKKLECVADDKSYNITHDALVLIAKNAQGSMRNAYSLLQQVTSGNKEVVGAEDVQKILGLSDPTYLFDLLIDIINADTGKCVLSLEKAAALGKDMSLMVNDLIEIIANAVIAKSASMDLIHETEQYKSLLSKIVDISYLEQLCHIADGLMDIRVNLRRCPDKTTVTVGIIRITSSSISKSFVSRLERIEKMLKSGQEIKISADAKEVISKDVDRNAFPADTKDISPVAGVISDVCFEDESAADTNISEEKEDKITYTEEVADNIEHSHSNQINSNDDIEVEESEEYEVEVQTENDEEFDVFSFLEDFNNSMVNTSATSKGNMTKSNEKEDESNKKKQLEERLKLVMGDDPVFSSAMMGCIKTLKENTLFLETPLKPVYEILNAYIMATEIKDIEAKFDPLVALS